MATLMLMTTYRCNKDCFYCPIKKGDVDMDFHVAKKAVDLLLTKKGKHKIKFFGGEPLLNLSLIKEVVDYVGPRAKFELVTNGELMDKNIFKYLSRNNFEVYVSFDLEVKNNLKLIAQSRDEKNESSLIATLVITPKNVTQIAVAMKSIIDLGVNNFNLLPVVFTVAWNDEYLEVLENEFRKIANIFWQRKTESKSLYLKGFVDLEAAEMAGVQLVNHDYFVDVNGDLYLSDAVLLLPEIVKEKLHCGNVMLDGSLILNFVDKSNELIQSHYSKEMLESNKKIKALLDRVNKLFN